MTSSFECASTQNHVTTTLLQTSLMFLLRHPPAGSVHPDTAGMAVRARVHELQCVYHARVSQEALRGSEDSSLPLLPRSLALYLHQNIRKWVFFVLILFCFDSLCLSIYLPICLSFSSHSFRSQADLYAGALFIQLALNKNSPEWLYLSILFLLAVAAVFTIAGGLTAVVWTDFVQTILMIVGALILMVMCKYHMRKLSVV